MQEQQLRDDLASLGISASNWRSVLMLPLIQVAWADHKIQSGERRELERIATMLGVEPHLQQRWLDERPTDAQLALGRKLVVELAYRDRGMGAELPTSVLDTIELLCERVAESAGGLFGFAFAVSPEEEIAISSISKDFRLASDDFLDQLPTPETGSFEDL